jgi:hypothetical protein
MLGLHANGVQNRTQFTFRQLEQGVDNKYGDEAAVGMVRGPTTGKGKMGLVLGPTHPPIQRATEALPGGKAARARG